MKKFKGFTLTELMVALVVIGILVAIVTPTIMKTRPNKNKMMIKKAYYTTENIVGSLINDPLFYPDKTDGCNDILSETACAYGFDDTTKVTYLGKDYTGATKFAQLFASKLNTKAHTGEVYTTTDGMTWDLSNTSWGNQPDAVAIITIDVNGAEKPNCLQAVDGDDFDQFRINLQTNGKMSINPADTKAAEFITINTSTIH